jgi:hypothetical protein
MVRVFGCGLVLLGLCALPACTTPIWPRPASPVATTMPEKLPEVPTTGSGFASLPRVPGERVVKHPELQVAKAPALPERMPAEVPKTLPTTISVPVAPPTDPALVAAVRAYIDNKPELAVEHLRGLDKPNQDLMLQLIPPMVRLSQLNMNRAGPVELGLLVNQLETPTQMLASRAPLIITKSEFCRRIRGFGRYEPLPEGHTFHPGDLAELYVEIKNVPAVSMASAKTGDAYLTELSTTLRIRDTSGNTVDIINSQGQAVAILPDQRREVTQSPLRDYHIPFLIPVPKKPGSYTVFFEILDPETGRAVSKGKTFRVANGS